jgi:hypothetical protein
MWDRRIGREFLTEVCFRNRDFAKQCQAEASASGRKREANSWRAQVRKLDREIAKYGLVSRAQDDPKTREERIAFLFSQLNRSEIQD